MHERKTRGACYEEASNSSTFEDLPSSSASWTPTPAGHVLVLHFHLTPCSPPTLHTSCSACAVGKNLGEIYTLHVIQVGQVDNLLQTASRCSPINWAAASAPDHFTRVDGGRVPGPRNDFIRQRRLQVQVQVAHVVASGVVVFSCADSSSSSHHPLHQCHSLSSST